MNYPIHHRPAEQPAPASMPTPLPPLASSEPLVATTGVEDIVLRHADYDLHVLLVSALEHYVQYVEPAEEGVRFRVR
ncbi:MAG TPA: hypothetical protein VIM06_00135 [Rhodanobacter sp.]